MRVVQAVDKKQFWVEGRPMRTHRSKLATTEPVGIVISDGGRGNVTSRLAAFVWGPVPEEVLSEMFESASSDEGVLLAAIA